MDGRRSQRQTKIDANPRVPLASYGIKIYGRDYQAWPSRYNEAFSTIIGSTCGCSTAEVIHSNYRSVLKGCGIETDLPNILGGENHEDNTRQVKEIAGENTQHAREIQQRAIALYEQTIGDKDSKGPTEYQWRLVIEDRVFGIFDQNSFQEGGRGRIRTNWRQDSHSRRILATNINSSPASIIGIRRRGSELDHPGPSSLPKTIADHFSSANRLVTNSGMIHQWQPTQPPAFDTNQRHNASNYVFHAEAHPDLTSPLPSHTRSSSYCSTSLNESHRSRYFASAMDRAVLEDDLGVEAYQGDQKPDRIVGLALSNSAYDYSSGPQREVDIYHQRVRELKLKRSVSLSPFKDGDFDALILPFVVFEAKRAHGTYWPELENQTGLPIAKFLRLQLNLQLETGRKPSECNALVWMFGAIGSEWHVYGCYAVWYKDKKEWRFKIVQLATMDIRVEKEAMRLLNIVDFIVLWGQVFRQNVIEDIKRVQV